MMRVHERRRQVDADELQLHRNTELLSRSRHITLLCQTLATAKAFKRKVKGSSAGGVLGAGALQCLRTRFQSCGRLQRFWKR